MHRGEALAASFPAITDKRGALPALSEVCLTRRRRKGVKPEQLRHGCSAGAPGAPQAATSIPTEASVGGRPGTRLGSRDQARRLPDAGGARRRQGAPVHEARLRLEQALSGDRAHGIRPPVGPSLRLRSMARPWCAVRTAWPSSTPCTTAATSARLGSTASTCWSSTGRTSGPCL